MAKLKGNGRAKSAGSTNISRNRAETGEVSRLAQQPRAADRRTADALVEKYIDNIVIFQAIGRAIFDLISAEESLAPLIHSLKYRVKDPEHLRDKLYRKCRVARAEKRSFDISEHNLYQKVNDLIGLRILHLHTSQILAIDSALQACLKREKYRLTEGPIAKTWDDESRNFYAAVGMKSESSKTQYTSVHYVFDAQNDFKSTFEIQVRTLAEELWGEVDHKINYPHRHTAIACTEQIAVLARVTASCTRLVDAIFRTDAEVRSKNSKLLK